jgi:hypothetical protein
MANKLGRLSQGVASHNLHSSTNTIAWIRHADIPKGCTVTYAHVVCDIFPQKDEVQQAHVTVGGNLIDYPGEVSTNTTGLTTAKLVMNSTISTKGARLLRLDIKNFYLNTPLDWYEYMRFPLWMIPEEIQQQYKILDIIHNSYVYAKICRGMYGLPQVGILAHKLLVKCLAPHGYAPTNHRPGLWTHKMHPILFSSWLMTLVLSMLAKNMPATSSKPSSCTTH